MSFSKHFAAFSILGTLTLSAPAWADIPPPDECRASEEGEACQNAIVDGEAEPVSGTCQKTMCTRATPDGPMTYECYRCVAGDPGAGGQANQGGSGSSAGTTSEGGKPAGGSTSSTAGKSSAAGTTSTAGKPSDPQEKDESAEGGCSVARAPGHAGGLAATLLVLGLALTGLFRRRSPVG
jgi:hypothetical protein